jgi:hypothetical protein
MRLGKKGFKHLAFHLVEKNMIDDDFRVISKQ